ncbi:arylsulfatase, partial [bacterium]|nr:arylsulfatase [bacterium]
DDLGYGDLSCYGQKKFKTPNIDKLAREGMLFTDHYSGSTVCAPSRCCLMTGLHTGHARVRGNYEIGPKGFGGELELRPEDITIAEILKEAGYRTGLFGKWGMGMDGTTGEPGKKGFDEWFGFLNQAHAHYYYPEYLWKNGRKVELQGNKNGKREQYVHDLITEEALQFVENNAGTPFFMYLAYTIPHAELLVPEDSLREYKGKFPETPYVKSFRGSFRREEDFFGDSTIPDNYKQYKNDPERPKPGFGAYCSQETPRAAFAAMVTRMDRDIGRLMKKLEKLGLDENTIVMFSSDNGPHKEGGHDPDFFNSASTLKGRKRDLYEGGIRIPMIARWPGKIKAGTVSSHISAFWDLMPTAAEIAGAESPEGIDGISFLPALLGDNAKQKNHQHLYWEFHERGTTEQAVRMGNWKAVRHAPNLPLELYNLKTDIGEERNVAERFPDIVKKLEILLNSSRKESKYWPLRLKV